MTSAQQSQIDQNVGVIADAIKTHSADTDGGDWFYACLCAAMAEMEDAAHAVAIAEAASKDPKPQ